MIQAIETSYAGHRFRSRLEARWAVLWDTLDIRWEYEPQGFRFDGYAYLPDFYLPQLELWVEVKGSEDALDKTLIETAAQHLSGNGLVTLGPIPEPTGRSYLDWAWQVMNVEDFEDHGLIPTPDWVAFGACAEQRTYVSATETSSTQPFWTGEPWLTPVWNCEGPNADAGYIAARSARFEHGESGPNLSRKDTQ